MEPGLSLLIFVVFWLAWSNGGNDNFKGVATLYGGGIASYRTALAWTTVATLAGSLLSVAVAGMLVDTFSGGGLLPDGLAGSRAMLIAVGAAGALTILLATLIGMPTSTTHALTGALVGVALVADPHHIQWRALATQFAQPLLLSPALAIAGGAILYFMLHRLRVFSGITRETCVCVGARRWVPVRVGSEAMAPVGPGGAIPEIHVSTPQACAERYQGRVVGIGVQPVVDGVHYLSAGAVSFARGLNDTPKILALLLITGAPLGWWQVGLVALAMTAGGLVHSRRVAGTLSHRITTMNAGQALAASLVTAGLVLGASRLGLPVSTTHVACGSIFGIGTVSRRWNWKVIAQILAAWVTTLPLGLGLGAGIYWAWTIWGS